ncbi:MAG: hypothetical protein CMG77_03085 [Marinimicrobium sp.]|jgi:hypothetical protein|nr:hypothetical protein [Marinimicrobium sp.]|tara:strand:+ start:276 stop:497 length:222 start_codon:yes stop_codon:yes gene_type:complete
MGSSIDIYERIGIYHTHHRFLIKGYLTPCGGTIDPIRQQWFFTLIQVLCAIQQTLDKKHIKRKVSAAISDATL